MTAATLFERLAPYVGPAIEATFRQQSLCILTTRVVIDVGAYFGIEVRPRSVQALVANRIFAEAVEVIPEENYDWDAVFAAGGYSVGIGFGMVAGVQQTDAEVAALNKWNGHLIAAAGQVVGDFSIQQAERPDHGIILGPALVGEWGAAPRVRFGNDEGVLIEYRDHANDFYKRSPDWREPTRRKPIVAELIRLVRDGPRPSK